MTKKLDSLHGWKKLTPFQRKVLAAVYRIPRGEVRTYAQVARAAGHPNAARAVGSVMKMNPYAPQVPCHRVVRSDGSLGHYSGKGGMAGKRKLLCQEGVKNGFKFVC
ncbi:MAG: MGMT family protein [Candidatus Micrarchaeota archaeon]|nr:MGMT family protein [Candidatus Micrarchaeota archaeon]